MSHHLWQVGECQVDLQRQVLMRDGEVVPIRPKAWSLLVVLLERPNAIVTNGQLMNHLWPRQSVDPKALVNVASDLRIRLGDPSALRCASRRGYFVVAVPIINPTVAKPLVPIKSGVRTEQELSAASSVFVGRERELRTLDDWASGAVSRGPQILRICGVAGAGKTALIEHWLTKVSASGKWNLLFGRAADMASEQEPFGPVLQMLSERSREPDRLDIIADIRRLAPCWLVQIPEAIAAEDHSRLVQEQAGAGAGRMIREGADLMLYWASRRPTLLVLEDVHWIDTATADLMIQLMRSTSRVALFIVFSARPPQCSEAWNVDAARLIDHDHLREQRSCSIQLGPLTEQSIAEYLSLRLPSLKIDRHGLQSVARWTEGSPLFLKVLADGIQGREPNSLGVITEIQNTSSAPTTLQAFVLSRVALLDPQRRAVLQALSCLATLAPVALLSEVLDVAQERVDAACEWLTQRGFLFRSGGLWPASDKGLEIGYRFSHDVYRHAINESLAPKLRKELNRRLARSLVRIGAARSSTLAAHLVLAFVNAEMPLDAAHALRIACSRSLSRYAPRHAVRALLQAIQQLESMRGDPAAISLRMEVCWELTGLIPFDAMSSNSELQLAWNGIFDCARSIDTPRAIFICAATECAMHINLGRTDLIRPAVNRLKQTLTMLDGSDQAVAALWHAMALGTSGSFAESLEVFAMARQLGAASQPSNTSVVFMAAFCRVWLLALSGRLAEFEAELSEFDEQLQHREIPHFAALGYFWTAEALRLLSCTEAAARRYGRVLSLCKANDIAIHIRETQLGLLACTEPAKRDLSKLQELATGEANKSPAWSDASVCIVTAETLLAAGRHADAARALSTLEGLQDRWPILRTEAMRLQSLCLAQAGQDLEARDLLSSSVFLDLENGHLPGLMRALGRERELGAPLRSRLHAFIEHCFAAMRPDSTSAHPDLDELRRLREGLLPRLLQA